MDRFEVRFPSVAAVALRILLRMPAALRRGVFTSAFARAEAAFNRGDFEALDRTSFVRTARLSHQGPQGTLEYIMCQTTDLDRGRVVRQVNEEV